MNRLRLALTLALFTLAAAPLGCAADEATGASAGGPTGTESDDQTAKLPTPYAPRELTKAELTRLCVPPSVMMHSKDGARLPKLLDWLAAHDYRGITYADFVAIAEGRMERPLRPVILSLDDVTPAYISSHFVGIVTKAHAAGFPVSLAVNPQVPPESVYGKNGWSTLRSWHEAGADLTTHGTMHYNLSAVAEARPAGALQSCDDHAAADGKLDTVAKNEAARSDLEFLLGKSACRIRRGSEAAMETLILPFGLPRYAPQDSGATDRDRKTYPMVEAKAEEHGIKLVVGIPGGRLIERTLGESGERRPQFPAFVGRIDIVHAAESPEVEIGRWYRCPKDGYGKPTDCELPRCAALDSGELTAE